VAEEKRIKNRYLLWFWVRLPRRAVLEGIDAMRAVLRNAGYAVATDRYLKAR
jgi:hypothetical protein